MDSQAMSRLWRYSLAAAAAALMAGCGGGGGGSPAVVAPPPVNGTPPPVVVVPAKYAVGGTVTGLGPGATLTLSFGSEKLSVGADGNFAFPNKVDIGAAYSITAAAPPGYTCRVTDGAGVVASADINKITVACAPIVLAGVVNPLQLPLAAASDGAGNLYVIDSLTSAVLKLSAAGAVTVVAGGSGQPGFVDGPAASARFGFRNGDIAIDAQGNLLVADGCNNAVRKITPAGDVTTLAGAGPRTCRLQSELVFENITDGTGAQARFNLPGKIISDGAGGALVLDTSNKATVRTVTAAGVVTVQYWRNPDPSQSDLIFTALARGADGTLYLADARRRIWKDVGGTLVFVAGGNPRYTNRDGIGADAGLVTINDMVVAPNGDLYVVDNAQVRRVTPAGLVTTIAGSANPLLLIDTPPAARFGSIRSVMLDGAGLVVLNGADGTLRRVGFDGAASMVAATPGVRDRIDGTGGAARISALNTLAADAQGNLYTSDPSSSVLRKITPDGTVTTIAGLGRGSDLLDGPLATAVLQGPHTVAVGRDGLLWVAEDMRLRKVQDGMLTTVSPSQPITDLAADADGNAIIADYDQQIVRITPAGQATVLVTPEHVRTLLKKPEASFEPAGMVADAAGNLYIADRGTAAVYKLAKSGELSLFAGTPFKDAGNIDGPAGTATLGFYDSAFMTIDDKGNLYLSGQGRVRMISPAGVLSTPDLGWGNPAITGLAYAKGKLYGLTRYAVLQTWLP